MACNGALLGARFFEDYCKPFTPKKKGWNSFGPSAYQRFNPGKIIE